MLTTDFAKSIRAKYPDGVTSDGVSYADMSDQDLVTKVVAKYPVYKNQIEDFDNGGIIGNPIEAVKEFGSDVIGAVKERVGNVGETLKQVGEEKPIAENIGDAFKQTADTTIRKPLRIAGQAAGLVGDVELATLKLIAPKFAEDLAAKGMQKISETELAQNVTQKIDEFKTAHPEAAQDIDDVINIASVIPELKAAQATIEGGTTAVKVGAKAVTETVDTLSDVTEASRAIKASGEVDDIVGRILQGSPDDFVKGKKALMTLNLKGNNIKTYTDLVDLTDDGISALGKKVDTVLDEQVGTVGKITKNAAEKTIEVEGQKISQNFVDDALTQLQKLYKDTADSVAEAKIKAIKKKFSSEGLTIKEFNDIAKEYGYAKNGFNLKSGQPLAGVNTQMYENTRKGIKSTLRELIPDEKTRNAVITMDESMSNLYTLKRLSSKMSEQVYKLYNKVEKRGIVEKIAGNIANVADNATLHSARGFIQKFFPSNIGQKSGNAIMIQENLSKNIKNLIKLNKIKNNSTLINEVSRIIINGIDSK